MSDSSIILDADVLWLTTRIILTNLYQNQMKAFFLGYSTNKVAYMVLIRCTSLIVESFDIKFDDYYVRNTGPSNETKVILESDIPASSGPLNIVEINYDYLFDPVDTSHLSKIIVSPVAQQQYVEVYGLSLYDALLPRTSTLLIKAESTTPVLITTIKVPVIEDATPVSSRRVTTQSNVSSESNNEEIERIDTRID